MFSGVTNHTSPSGILIDEHGFGGCQENGAYLTVLCQLQSLLEGGLWCWELGSVP